MTDIAERLRLSVTKGHEPTDADAIEAADEIERLKAARHADSQRMVRMSDEYEAAQDEIEQLREQLEKYSKFVVKTQKYMAENIALIRDLNLEAEQLSEQLAEATAEIEKLRDLWENSPMAAR